MVTRRALLGAGAVLALAGCGDREPERPPEGDAGVLAGLLAVERSLVAAWEPVAALPGRAGAAGRAVLEHERAHERLLRVAVRDAGGAPVPAVAAGVARAAGAVGERADVGSGRRALRAALALEREASAAYIAALSQLRDGDRRALAAAIGATETQHQTVIRLALGREPLPDAFAGRGRA